uniref:Uncharacterized protein n=1 Tax=Nelumbo nucifera TaxID=4432 RepID=A0A822ZDZ5_NELNU|nr:TPA_asm: hypothetical protein HUJ06_000950 [Nelumbo nucifera]
MLTEDHAQVWRDKPYHYYLYTYILNIIAILMVIINGISSGFPNQDQLQLNPAINFLKKAILLGTDQPQFGSCMFECQVGSVELVGEKIDNLLFFCF